MNKFKSLLFASTIVLGVNGHARAQGYHATPDGLGGYDIVPQSQVGEGIGIAAPSFTSNKERDAYCVNGYEKIFGADRCQRDYDNTPTPTLPPEVHNKLIDNFEHIDGDCQGSIPGPKHERICKLRDRKYKEMLAAGFCIPNQLTAPTVDQYWAYCGVENDSVYAEHKKRICAIDNNTPTTIDNCMRNVR